MHHLKSSFQEQSRDSHVDISKYNKSDVITRDVCIIGGGAAGTYAAIQLQAKNKSVVVVEKEDRLGGQTATYVDPESAKPVEYGVTWYMDLPVVRAFFEQLGVATVSSHFTSSLDYWDFRTGEHFTSRVWDRSTLEVWRQKMLEYPFLRLGFDLPDPVPEELLLPFEEYVEKHDLIDLLPSLGGLNFLGDWMRQPTLYVMKYMNMGFVTGLRDGFLKPANRNNSSLYCAALSKLRGGGDNVLLGSRVLHMDRECDSDWIYIEVQSGFGDDNNDVKTRLIRAKRLVAAVPPLPATLQGFDLNTKETELFSQFRHTYCYTAVVKIKGLPADVCYINRGPENPYPRLPCVFSIRPSDVPEVHTLHIGSSTPLSEDEVKLEVISGVRSFQLTTPEIMAVGDHSPYQLTVTAEAIAGRFYSDLNALQGQRRTYYIGSAFESHNSPQIWQLTDQLLESSLLPSLEE